MTSSSSCPHCGSCENVADAQYCQQCHQALPVAADAAPRATIDGGSGGGIGRPMTMSGHTVHCDELHEIDGPSTGSGAMLVVALLQMSMGAIWYFCYPATPENGDPLRTSTAGAFVLGIGVVFFLFYLWSHVQPLAANIVGLVVYVLIMLADAMVDRTALYRGLIFKIVIVVVLCRAIATASAARQADARPPRPAY